MSGARLRASTRRADALVAERRRQPDVHDRDVGLLHRDHAEERVGVVDRRDDFEPVVPEQAGEPSRRSASSSAITTRTAAPPSPSSVLPPGWPPAASRRASHPLLEPREPVPPGSAPPRPSSPTSATERAVRRRTRTSIRSGSAYLIAFARASATTK